MATLLRDALAAAGIGQRAAARKLGVSQSTLSRILSGSYPLGPGVAEACAAALTSANPEPLPDLKTGQPQEPSGTGKPKETLTLFLSPQQASSLQLMGRALGLTRGELVQELVDYMTAAGTPQRCVERRARMFRARKPAKSAPNRPAAGGIKSGVLEKTAL
jgi:transcriptional regulator with XRE-family HTH domain